jgi:hypothetical protein
MSWEKLMSTPSRLSVAPIHREERQRLLTETATKGYTTNYQGIRISSTGKKYNIQNITIWNLKNEQNQNCGQAASFSQWENCT